MAYVNACRGECFETIFPRNWFASVPENKTAPSAAPWSHVTLSKCNEKGNIITENGQPVHFTYHLEKSTGDLYGLQTRIDPPHIIASKAVLMFLGAPFYTFGVMAVNFIRIIVDVSAIFWRVIPQLFQEVSKKGIFSSLCNATLAITWEIPKETINDIWRIVRSPIYGFGMMAACLFAIASPLEGRKWLDKIEYEWHEQTSYKRDFRYKKSIEQYKKVPFSEWVSEVKAGKVIYLGYCMQKRGNIHEHVAGKPRYTEIKKE